MVPGTGYGPRFHLVPMVDVVGTVGLLAKGASPGDAVPSTVGVEEGKSTVGSACDPLAGKCRNPFELDPKPHSELRRRKRDLTSARHQPTPAGKSSAPAILVVVPKDDGIVDAFWFFFYSFNLGQKSLQYPLWKPRR